MQTRQRAAALGAGAAALALTLTACSGGAPATGDGTAVEGGDLVFAIDQDIGCVDMRQTTLRALLQLSRQTVDSLVYIDDAGEPSGWLAESWEVNDDASEFTFRLRDDVVFSDGSALTATTVKQNFDQLVEQGATAQLAATYLAPTYVETEVIDQHTAKVVFSAPNASFLYAASTPNLGLYSDASTELTGDELCQGQFSTSGAYLIDDYMQNEQTVLVRNEDYAWGPGALENSGTGYADTITFPVIQDTAVVAGSAIAGDLHIALGTSGEDVSRLNEAGWRQSSEPEPALSASWLVRLGSGIIGTDAAVREAIMIGLDRESLMDVATTQQAPATGVLNAAHPFSTDQSDALAYDPEGAIEILEEAGWMEGADGIRQKDGQPLVINSIFYVTSAQPILELAQQQLSQLGIDLRLELLTSADTATRRTEGNFEVRHDWYTGPEPVVISNATLELNRPSQLDVLIEAQNAEVDLETRREIVAEMNDLILEEGLIIPIYTQNSTAFISASVTDRVQDVGGLLMLSQMQLLE